MSRRGLRLGAVLRAPAAATGMPLGLLALRYLTAHGAGPGLNKVQHGKIHEVGIVEKRLISRGYRKNFRFLNSFRSYL